MSLASSGRLRLPSDGVSSRLVGRAVELGGGTATRRRLAQGVGRFLCVEGEAGIGKTTLLGGGNRAPGFTQDVQ